jgi:hypothetical protein
LKKFEKVEKTGFFRAKFLLRCTLSLILGARVTLGTNQVLKEVDSSESSGERISFDLGSKQSASHCYFTRLNSTKKGHF